MSKGTYVNAFDAFLKYNLIIVDNLEYYTNKKLLLNTKLKITFKNALLEVHKITPQFHKG